MNRFFLLYLMWYSVSASAFSDLLIYSYNRPLQLYALLESAQRYIVGIEKIMVIYRAGDFAYENAYGMVKKDFPAVQFYCQTNPPHDFKELTLQCMNSSKQEYILFAVDDIVVKDYVDIAQCIALMEEYGAYGFFLRLGKHLTYCYATFSEQKLPQFIKDDKNICVWNFSEGQWDWGYPHSLDMTIYRKKDVLGWLTQLDYASPNQLEYYLALYASYGPRGICYENSKIINLPINIVQTYTYNNCVHSYSPEKLLELFNEGHKLDTRHLHQVQNSACHMFDAPIAFMQR